VIPFVKRGNGRGVAPSSSGDLSKRDEVGHDQVPSASEVTRNVDAGCYSGKCNTRISECAYAECVLDPPD
jgi:hypothetical protein